MRLLQCFVLAAAVLLLSCGGTKPIVVGSKAGPEQVLLGEILAQHLEKSLGVEVQRRLALGDTRILNQAMMAGDVMLYPEYAGLLLSEILKESPSRDPVILMTRARAEIARVAMLELMEPLGFDNRFAVVVRAAGAEGIDTISQAAERKDGWKLGITYDFQESSDGLVVLNAYRLPPAAAPRAIKDEQLFQSLQEGSVTMIVAPSSDGHLISPEWKILKDDRNTLAPQQAAVLVRQDAFRQEPRLKAALAQLSGKLNLETARKMNAQVVLDKRPPAEVAAEFLKSAGLR